MIDWDKIAQKIGANGTAKMTCSGEDSTGKRHKLITLSSDASDVQKVLRADCAESAFAEIYNGKALRSASKAGSVAVSDTIIL